MKKLFLILCLIVPSFAFGQTWNQSATNWYRVNVINPSYDSTGALTHFVMNTSNGSTLTNATSGQTVIFNLPANNFDLIPLGTTTVTADNVTITYKQLADLIVAACLQQNPLPAVTTNNAK